MKRLGKGYLEFLADSYNLIVNDTLKEQLYFQRNKKYRYSTFDEVSDIVYFNDEYMKKYMYGLAITSYFWKQHKKINNFFDDVLPLDKEGIFLEIGPGHGNLMAKAMSRSSYNSFLGVDISPTSIELTEQLLKANVWGESRDYELMIADFLDGEFEGTYDAIIMGEVLEHVEQPSLFLEKIASLSKKDSFIFITTCINTPAIDHLALFRSVEEIKTLFSNAGLEVKNSILVPYDKMNVDETMDKRLPLLVAFVLKVI
jgi:2-polyprenyl-3-methyl-5-hydroxy-6-metoxy-1,4-benzoquinol methylase